MKRSCMNYDPLSARLGLLVPDATLPQLGNLALFIYGFVRAGHVHLPKSALFLPIPGNTRNALQRLERFRKNKAASRPSGTKGVARAVRACWKNRAIELIMDQTDRDARFHLLFVALAYRKRAIAILWTLLPHEGGSGAQEQTKLLGQVRKLLPPPARWLCMRIGSTAASSCLPVHTSARLVLRDPHAEGYLVQNGGWSPLPDTGNPTQPGHGQR